MKKNIIALSLLVACFSASSHLYAMDSDFYNPDSESDHEQTQQENQEYAQDWDDLDMDIVHEIERNVNGEREAVLR